MGARATRWRRRIVATVLVGGFLLLAGLTFLVASAPGARLLFRVVAPRLPLVLTADRIQGTLWGPLLIRGITYEKDGIQARIDRVYFDWNPLALTRKHLAIEAVEIEGPAVTLVLPFPEKPASADTTAKERGELPLRITLDRAEVTGLSVVVPTRMVLQDGALTAQGSPESYTLEAKAGITAPKSPPLSVALSAQGSLSAAHIQEALVAMLGGTVRIEGDVAWDPEVTWSLRADGTDLAVGDLAPEPAAWPGAIAFRCFASGKMVDEIPHAQARLDTLHGSLRGLPVGGHAAVTLTGREVRIPELALAWGTLHAEAAGAAGDTLDLEFSLFGSALESLDPRLGGEFAFSGRVSGARAAPDLDLTGGADSLRFAPARIGRVDVTAAIAAAFQQPSRVSITARDVHSGTNTLDTLGLVLDGTRLAHGLAVSLVSPQASLAVHATGAFPDSTWLGAIDTLTLSGPRFDPWTLEGPAPLRAGPGSADLDSLRLVSGEASLRLRGAWSAAQGWMSEVALARFPLRRLQAAMPESLSVGGYLEATAQGSGTPDGALLGRASMTWSEGFVRAVVHGSPDTLHIREARVDGSIGPGGLSSSMSLALVSMDGADLLTTTAQVAIPEYRTTTDSLVALPLTGQVTGTVFDLRLLEVAQPRIVNTTGRLDLECGLAGTASALLVSGSMHLEDAGTEIPDLGLVLQKMHLEARGDASQGFAVTGRLTSGDGSLDLVGSSPLFPTPERPIRLHFEGERFLAANTSELLVEMSPRLDLEIGPSLVLVRGEVTVPRASIELMEPPAIAVKPSPDVVYIGTLADSVPPAVVIDTEVRVILGDEVFFRGLNTAAKLEGSLLVVQQTPSPPTGAGGIVVRDGYYRAYGQNLNLDDGRAVFAGPLTNPGLDFKAYRMAGDGTEAGVVVTGTAEVPELKLYTDPPREQREALSYIITGRPLESASGEDQAKVADAAAVLGSNLVTAKMGSKVGLDEARVETGGSIEEAALVAGKYLSPQLYVSYGIGLFDRVSQFRARYLLTPQWSVQAETGKAMGTDLLYRFELGRKK